MLVLIWIQTVKGPIQGFCTGGSHVKKGGGIQFADFTSFFLNTYMKMK